MSSLENRLGDLQESLLLNRARDEMGDIESALSMLPAEVEALRKRGYVFRSFLDQKLSVLAEQWEETRDRVALEIDRRTQDLERDASTAESATQHQPVTDRSESVASPLYRQPPCIFASGSIGPFQAATFSRPCWAARRYFEPSSTKATEFSSAQAS